MLLALSIRDFVIVDRLDLEFGPGFTVLTGETGAGKSILIDALLLALGERADADVVREGAARAEVAAEFRAGPAVAAWLAGAGLGTEGAESVLLRRTIDAGGRSRAFIDGSAATLAQLKEVGDMLLDVHGQHAHQSLLRAAAQQQLLDEHGGRSGAAREVTQAFQQLRRATQRRSEAEASSATAEAEREHLADVVEELTVLAPEPGEWERVATEQKRLAHAAALLEGARGALDAVLDGDDAVSSRIDAVTARLNALAGYDERLRPVLEALDNGRIQIAEAGRELNHYLSHCELDEGRLAQVEARVGALHAAARKFRSAPESLGALVESARARLATLAAAADLEGLRAEEALARERFTSLAQALSAARAAAAANMGREVTRAMQDLSMSGGRFEAALTPAEASGFGLERVEFLVSAHGGSTPRALAKVASGGELSRISLAVSVIAATATAVPTLIFDEVDAGIGGAVAETVGRLLKQLGQLRQVLCVTHLPQVAARADQHLVVTKAADGNGRPVSRIRVLDRRSRVEELARMLGGVEITDTTRQHAREMLS
ncbi:MAG TPA: DNA repair protein RecN [Burkholderiaceae bacterium]